MSARAFGLPRAVAAPVVALQAALVAGLVVYAAHSLTGVAPDAPLLEDWLYDGLLVAAALLCVARGVLVRADRAAWLALGAGLASWSAGVIDATLHPQLQGGGFPSRTDLLWLGFYPGAYAGLALLVRARVRELRATLWLDGLVGALALAAVVAAFAFSSLVAAGGGDRSGVLADLTYPVADVVLGGFVLWVSALTQWRPGRVLGLVGVALIAGAFIDVYSLWSAVTDHATTALDWLWPASAVLLAVAGWQRPQAAPAIDFAGLRPLLPPVVFAGSAVALLLYSRVNTVDTAGFVLASATLVAVIARMAVTFAENLRLLAHSREEAVTDPLTGLGNRRLLLRDLEAVVSNGEPHGLLIFDLDGFKGYNDAFGHPAGDALLARLGGRLRDAVGEAGVAYRLGGDEFCALVRLEDRSLSALADAAAAALSERGRGFTVGTSVGTVRLPAEAATVSTALQIADERLYANKGRRRAAGDQIPLVARVIAVYNAYDAMVTDSTSSPAMPPSAALAELSRRAGGEFDPVVVRAVCAQLTGRHNDAMTPRAKAA